MSNLLGVAGLEKRYNGTRAVAGVAFTVPEGVALGVIGESGSGKTTLALLLAGLERPDAGSIELDGRQLELDRSRSDRRAIQIIFQDPLASLNPRLSALASVEDFLVVHGIGNRAERRRLAFEALESVHLSESVARRWPAELSGGQRQRVCLARALAVGPRVLVADEPTSALDVSIQSQILNLLVELKQERKLALVFISHDMSVVRYVADRIAVMLRGEFVEEGDRDEVTTRPQAEYTRTLLRAAEEMT